MKKQKICIVGDGLTGLTTALIFSSLNIDVHLVGPKIRKKISDSRTTAVSANNYDFLIKFIGEKNSKYFWPSKGIDLYHELDSDYRQFMNFEKKGENLMYIFKNEILKKIIKNKLTREKKIKIYTDEIKNIDENKAQIILNKKKIVYDLILVCTGQKSKLVKNLVGTRFINKDINEIAFTSIFSHKLNLPNSRQYFLKEGPLAILPIGKNQCSFVWSMNKNHNFKNINIEIMKKIKIILKSKKNIKIKNLDFFPISFKFNINCIKNNFLVLGEGSYNVHPVAGQGFNLILRDIKGLKEEIEKNLINGIQLKDSLVLTKYLEKRKPENLFFGLGINFINSFFKYNKSIEPIKNIILRDINKFKILKDISLNFSNRGLF